MNVLKWISQIAAACLVVFFIGFFSETVAQITTNNALPVGKGKGIFRTQNVIVRGTSETGNANRELLVQAFPFVGVYGITNRLSIFGVVPLLDRSLTIVTPDQSVERSGDFGLGDVRLFTRYDLYRNSQTGRFFSISPFGGVELPTGNDNVRDDIGPIPQPLQRGSGSVDPFAGLVITWQNFDWFFNLTNSYQINTEANNFEFGDSYRLDGVAKYRLFPRELRSRVSGFFYLLLESNLIVQYNNQINGVDDPNSGGTTWFVDPGLQYITRKFVFEAAIQLPAVQDLNGTALETDFITTLSIRINI